MIAKGIPSSDFLLFQQKLLMNKYDLLIDKVIEHSEVTAPGVATSIM
jgi:hypothetical protein